MKRILFISKNPEKFNTFISTMVKKDTEVNIINNFALKFLKKIENSEFNLIVFHVKNFTNTEICHIRLISTFTDRIKLFVLHDKSEEIIAFNGINEYMKTEDFMLNHQFYLKKHNFYQANNYDDTSQLAKKNKNILLIDDDVISYDIVKSILNEYNVIWAENGLIALDIVKEYPYIDLILLDITMPKMDGYEFIDSLREIKAYKSCPVIVVTASAKIESVIKFAKHEILSYLLKPFDKNALLNRVQKILEK